MCARKVKLKKRSIGTYNSPIPAKPKSATPPDQRVSRIGLSFSYSHGVSVGERITFLSLRDSTMVPVAGKLVDNTDPSLVVIEVRKTRVRVGRESLVPPKGWKSPRLPAPKLSIP